MCNIPLSVEIINKALLEEEPKQQIRTDAELIPAQN
jgi:hypothetical protein